MIPFFSVSIQDAHTLYAAMSAAHQHNILPSSARRARQFWTTTGFQTSIPLASSCMQHLLHKVRLVILSTVPDPSTSRSRLRLPSACALLTASCFAGMSTIRETVDALGLPPDAAQRLKEWLISPGVEYNLDGVPDSGFYRLTDQQLREAGLSTVQQRNLVLSELRAPTGELHAVSLLLERTVAPIQLGPFLRARCALVCLQGYLIRITGGSENSSPGQRSSRSVRKKSSLGTKQADRLCCLNMERWHRIWCSLHGVSQHVELLAHGPSPRAMPAQTRVVPAGPARPPPRAPGRPRSCQSCLCRRGGRQLASALENRQPASTALDTVPGFQSPAWRCDFCMNSYVYPMSVFPGCSWPLDCVHLYASVR